MAGVSGMEESTLQERFLRSKGRPVAIGEWLVHQLVRAPLRCGHIVVTFESGTFNGHGLCFEAPGGEIATSSGRRSKLVRVWKDPRKASTELWAICPRGELVIWNVYETLHRDGTTTIDQWTGNAGIVELARTDSMCRLGCGRSSGPFDPSQLVASIRWQPSEK